MKGYYFADRGGSFMSAVLKSMHRRKVIDPVLDKDGAVVLPGQIAAIPARERHRFSVTKPRPYGAPKRDD